MSAGNRALSFEVRVHALESLFLGVFGERVCNEGAFDERAFNQQKVQRAEGTGRAPASRAGLSSSRSRRHAPGSIGSIYAVHTRNHRLEHVSTAGAPFRGSTRAAFLRVCSAGNVDGANHYGKDTRSRHARTLGQTLRARAEGALGQLAEPSEAPRRTVARGPMTEKGSAGKEKLTGRSVLTKLPRLAVACLT